MNLQQETYCYSLHFQSHSVTRRKLSIMMVGFVARKPPAVLTNVILQSMDVYLYIRR